MGRYGFVHLFDWIQSNCLSAQEQLLNSIIPVLSMQMTYAPYNNCIFCTTFSVTHYQLPVFVITCQSSSRHGILVFSIAIQLYFSLQWALYSDLTLYEPLPQTVRGRHSNGCWPISAISCIFISIHVWLQLFCCLLYNLSLGMTDNNIGSTSFMITGHDVIHEPFTNKLS